MFFKTISGMERLFCFVRMCGFVYSYLGRNLVSLGKSVCVGTMCLLRFLLWVDPFWIQLFYFLFISSFGFWVLAVLKPRTHGFFQPRNLDLFFTSVSASTVSSMSTIEMEVFSDSQLIVLTILMLIGGEVFTSMVGLQLRKFKLKLFEDKIASVPSDLSIISSNPPDILSQIELGMVKQCAQSKRLKYKSIKFLGFVVLGYLLVFHLLGIAMVLVYLKVVSSAREVLKQKELRVSTFAFFLVVSTFASCGFVPTNENMIVFRKNLGLLVILIPQALLGNTLFPSCLRFCIWSLGKFMNKSETGFLLKNSEEIGYLHLLPKLHSLLLVATVFGFVLIQLVAIGSMEWTSNALIGLNFAERSIGILFLSVNSRHTGESTVDLSTLSPAILFLLVAMMYLPPYTSFMPVKSYEGEEEEEKENELNVHKRNIKIKRAKFLDNLLLSQLSYLIIFIFIICITERHNIKEDPFNFNLFHIIFEVISAYGNVGFTMGYSCKRQIHSQSNCVDKSFGFSGKWSDNGKLILIVVMIFGRLKKFNLNKQTAWKLL